MFFQKTTLRDQGLQIQLGHVPGVHCPTLEWGHKDFIVIHTNGIHLVNVDFCHCWGVLHFKQLLCITWWPATPTNPKTCTTMDCLQQFHLLNLQSSVTVFGYYSALQYMSDNVGLERIPVSQCSCKLEDVLISTLGPASCFHSDDTHVLSHKDVEV